MLPLIFETGFDLEKKKGSSKEVAIIYQGKMYKQMKLDVRNDAERILEELLQNRIDIHVRGPHKVRRLKTGPESSGKGSVHANGVQNSIARSKTLPSKYRQSLDGDEIKQNDSRDSQEVVQPKLPVPNVEKEDSGSSADTEEILSHSSEKRKKKDFFKRMKERILRTFNREEKERLNSVKSMERDHKSKEGSENGGQNSVKKGRGSIFSSFRKSKKSLPASPASSQNNTAHQRKSNGTGGSGASPVLAVNPVASHALDKPEVRRISPRSGQRGGGLGRRHDSLDASQRAEVQSPDSDRERVPLFASRPQELPGSFGPASSVDPRSSFGMPHTDITLDSPAIVSTVPSILDSPGDDIDYIDSFDCEGQGQYGVPYTGGPPGVNPPSPYGYLTVASYSPTGPQGNVRSHLEKVKEGQKSDERVFLAECPDGATGTNVDGAVKLISAHVPEIEYDELDGFILGPAAEHPPSSRLDKDDVYGVIAQKLCEMGDSYSAAKFEQQRAATEPELSSLEREIIACLRSEGDRFTKHIDKKLETAHHHTTQDLYQRFCSTVQNSMGSELSWDHLAVLFYTTKGVISAVGKGSEMAVMAKECVLQYVTDMFASWIVDQGGFKILVSSEESDFDVD